MNKLTALTALLLSSTVFPFAQSAPHSFTFDDAAALHSASAVAVAPDAKTVLYAVRFGSDVYRFIFAAKRMTPETDRAFREAVGSFRRMALAESQAAKPLHIRVATVEAGDTIQGLASRMATPDHSLERFRILNGFEPHDRLTPGQPVKLVTD